MARRSRKTVQSARKFRRQLQRAVSVNKRRFVDRAPGGAGRLDLDLTHICDRCPARRIRVGSVPVDARAAAPRATRRPCCCKRARKASNGSRAQAATRQRADGGTRPCSEIPQAALPGLGSG